MSGIITATEYTVDPRAVEAAEGLAPTDWRSVMHPDSSTPPTTEYTNLVIPDGPAAREKFWSKVDRTDSCWRWTGGRGGGGHGAFYFKGRNYVASRVSWTYAFGPIPNGLNVCHHCDNPSCVNPGHLFIGTQKDNIRDMDRKGRRVVWHPSGERNPKAKLTREQVQEIRQIYRFHSRDFGSKPLARRFDVAQSTITTIARGESWKPDEQQMTTGTLTQIRDPEGIGWIEVTVMEMEEPV